MVGNDMPAPESGQLTRPVPHWYADAGAISLHHALRILLPGKTRALIDRVADAPGRQKLAERFAGSRNRLGFLRLSLA